MAEVQLRIATDMVDDSPVAHQLALCWLEVSNAGGAVGFAFPPVTLEQVTDAVSRLVSDAGTGAVVVFVAEVESEIVGWVSLRLNKSKLTSHWASVERLQSRPDHRGLGIGEGLMSFAREHAASIGLEQLHLVLRGGERLEGFYERLGWREIGRHPGALRLSANDDRDEVAMQLELP